MHVYSSSSVAGLYLGPVQVLSVPFGTLSRPLSQTRRGPGVGIPVRDMNTDFVAELVYRALLDESPQMACVVETEHLGRKCYLAGSHRGLEQLEVAVDLGLEA